MHTKTFDFLKKTPTTIKQKQSREYAEHIFSGFFYEREREREREKELTIRTTRCR